MEQKLNELYYETKAKYLMVMAWRTTDNKKEFDKAMASYDDALVNLATMKIAISNEKFKTAEEVKDRVRELLTEIEMIIKHEVFEEA